MNTATLERMFRASENKGNQLMLVRTVCRHVICVGRADGVVFGQQKPHSDDLFPNFSYPLA